MFYSDNIRTIVDKLNESFFVPDIQRSYVWLQNPKEKRIENLFDSLMRGYPIGSFLFWNLKRSDIETDNSDKETEEGKLNFQLYKFIENYDVRKSHNEKINISQVKSEDLHIVLDGQQRLTSLYIGLRGSRTLKRPYSRKNDANQYEEKFLYLNLSSTFTSFSMSSKLIIFKSPLLLIYFYIYNRRLYSLSLLLIPRLLYNF